MLYLQLAAGGGKKNFPTFRFRQSEKLSILSFSFFSPLSRRYASLVYARGPFPASHPGAGRRHQWPYEGVKFHADWKILGRDDMPVV